MCIHTYIYIYTRINCSFRNAFARQAGPSCPIVKSVTCSNLCQVRNRPSCVSSRLARGPAAFLRGARLTNVADQRAARESLGCVAERELAGLRAHWRTRHTRTA